MTYALSHIWRVKHGITSGDETSNHAISDPFAYSFKIEMKIHSIQGNNLHKLFPVHCTLRFFFFLPHFSFWLSLGLANARPLDMPESWHDRFA